MSKPVFLKYYEELENKHLSILNQLHLDTLKLIDEVKEEKEKEVVRRNQLIGFLILFDKMANKEILKRSELVIRILLLIYNGSSIKDQMISKFVWDISLRTIATADRWKKFKPLFEYETETLDQSSSFSVLTSRLSIEKKTEIEECTEKILKERENQKVKARGIIDSIIHFSENAETKNLVQEDTRIFGSIDIWM